MDVQLDSTAAGFSGRLGWGSLLFMLLVSVLLRGSELVSNHLHVDEPRWMVRGLLLIESLRAGDAATLQTDHWTGRITPEMSKLSASLASGSVTAILTGTGVQLGERLLPTLSSRNEPFKQIFCARVFHALLSSLTPLLLFLLLRRRVSEAGAVCAAGFLMFEPLIHYWGGMAHLEAVLTLAAPVSLLLYEMARRRGSIRLVVAAGLVFGLAFANRANAAAIPLALLVYTGIRVWTEPGGKQSIWVRIRKEGLRLLLFGLTGWVVFVLLYPPIWGTPVWGFLAFVKVYLTSSGLAGMNRLTLVRWLTFHSVLAWVFLILTLLGLLVQSVRRQTLFQLGAAYYVASFTILMLPTTFHSRYLSSVLPALAFTGSVTSAWLWGRYSRRSRRTSSYAWWALCAAAMILLLCSLAGARVNYRSIRERYGELHDLGFSEVHFPSRRVKYVRLGKEERERGLFVTSKASTPALPALYLGISLTDHARYERVQPGWIRVKQEEGVSCRQGDWEFGGSRPGRRPDQRSVGHRRLYFWPCTG